MPTPTPIPSLTTKPPPNTSSTPRPSSRSASSMRTRPPSSGCKSRSLRLSSTPIPKPGKSPRNPPPAWLRTGLQAAANQGSGEGKDYAEMKKGLLLAAAGDLQVLIGWEVASQHKGKQATPLKLAALPLVKTD